MMKIRLATVLLTFLIVVSPNAAEAGQTARYRHLENGGTVQIEAQGERARLEFPGQNWHVLTNGSEAYIVLNLPDGVRVIDMALLEQMVREGRAEVPATAATSDDLILVEQGEATIGGHRGKAFYLRTPDGMSPRPGLVVSQDPALAAIGRPLVRQLDYSFLLMRISGTPIPRIVAQMRDLIGDGTALLYAGFALEALETSEIGPQRFELPAPPLTIEQMRQAALLNSTAR